MPIERDESQVGASRKILASIRDTMDQNAQVRNQVRSTCPQVQLSSKNSAGSVSTEPICFATHDAFAVLDLGASKTVIGSDHVACLIRSLDKDIRDQLSRCKCQITFKFGNQSTLTSHTPFLISNTFM